MVAQAARILSWNEAMLRGRLPYTTVFEVSVGKKEVV
jgi:hypothetical protein